MRRGMGPFFAVILLAVFASISSADLADIKTAGELRHLGVPYANFVTGDGEGLDTEILKRYCQYIGVKYRYVITDWDNVISDLSGKKIGLQGGGLEIGGSVPVKGDIIGNGFTTMIPWRMEVFNYSAPYFPSSIWVLARADSKLQPIQPTMDPEKDVTATRALLNGREVLSIRNTWVDVNLYNLTDV